MGLLTDLPTARQAIPRLAPLADAEVTRLIGEASDIIESYCNRAFAQQQFTETHDADGSGRLFLRQRPVASIQSITAGLPTGPTTLDPASYQFDPTTGEVRGAGSTQFFPSTPFSYGAFALSGFQSVRVVYTASYGATPPAVAGRCLAILGRAAAQLARDPAIRAKTLGNVSFTYADFAQYLTLTPDDRRVLSPYRVYRL